MTQTSQPQERSAAPTLHLNLHRWLGLTAAVGLDTCLARAKFIGADYRHLNALEQPGPDGLSREVVGNRVIALIMLSFPRARADFGRLFVPLDGPAKLDRTRRSNGRVA